MKVGRLTNKLVVRDGVTSPRAARRLVEACARHDLANFEPDVDGFVAIRRLNVRLVSKDGLPSRRALSKAWRAAIQQALATEFRAAKESEGAAGKEVSRYGVGENLVVWPSDRRARFEWLKRWTSRAERVWWSSAVARTIGVEAPLEPAHLLTFWARDEPEDLPARVLELGVRHAAFRSSSRDDLEEVWSVYSTALSDRRKILGRAGAPPASFEVDQVDEVRRRVADFGLTRLVDSPVERFVARMVLRSIRPALSPQEVDDLIEAMGRKTASESVEKSPTREDDIEVVGRPTEADRESVERVESALDVPRRADELWLDAGHALLIHPLLAETHRRHLEGERFEDVWNGLLHAAFFRTHGPGRHALQRALESAGPAWENWFNGRPSNRWLDEPDVHDADWIEQLAGSLPEEWGTVDERWRRLTRRPGEVVAELPFVAITYPLRSVDIEIRKRGWDIDPGWVPALNRVLRFHYKETAS